VEIYSSLFSLLLHLTQRDDKRKKKCPAPLLECKTIIGDIYSDNDLPLSQLTDAGSSKST